MSTRLSLLGLALLLPLAACETEEVEPVEADPVVVDPVAPAPAMDDPMASDVTPSGTLEAVQGAGGLLQLPIDAAVSNIDGWIAQLEGNPDFEPVVADLRDLRTELQEPEIDGAAVGQLLVDLGTATTGAAAGNAELTQLGEALTAAGNELTGM